MRSLLICLFTLFVFFQETTGQKTAPFTKGINLTNWFQVSSPTAIQFTKYEKKDFEQIKSLGCDVIRLPINLHAMTSGAPNYTPDPLFLSFLDQAIDWAEELEIHLIIDNHTFDPATNTDPNIGEVLTKVWPQMTTHFKDRGSYVHFEILNEPHGIADDTWNAIQLETVAAIRAIDSERSLIIGPASWNSFQNLAAMPAYDYENLIYTFHFYEPFVLTHQGASWVDPSMESLSGVPFPYDASRMPTTPSQLNGTWVGDALTNYSNQGNVDWVKSQIQIAVDFAVQRDVALFCGEFGVYIPNSTNQDRVPWYQLVREEFEAAGMAWTMWDYHGGFGLFNSGGQDLFEHDLNTELSAALGFNTPSQTPFEIQTAQAGFPVYTDYIGAKFESESSTSGTLNFYSEDRPNNDDYCIRWAGAAQYNSINLNIKPDLDLSQLRNGEYALDFFMRSTNSNVALDLRFLDSKKNSTDRPWRIRKVLTSSEMNGNNEWQHFHLRLRDFTEHGAWDDNTWFNPEGKFNWAEIDRLEIVTEEGAFGLTEFWFDNIIITNQDTAQVNSTSVINGIAEASAHGLIISPNPSQGLFTLSAPLGESWNGQIYNMQGQAVLQFSTRDDKEINLKNFPNGIYLVVAKSEANQNVFKKLIKE